MDSARTLHHEHQLPLRSPRNRPAPCIMSISCPCAHHDTAPHPASCFSAALALSTKPPRTLHHEHQLPLRSPRNRPAPCIMSISCPCALHETAPHHASCASAALALSTKPPRTLHHVLSTKPPRTLHHEHQLPLRSPRNRPAPCIMSISCPCALHETAPHPASCFSAALALSTKPPRTLYHEHQLPLRSPRNRPAPYIMSISCPCALHETALHPASRASAALALSTKPPRTLHHEHQLPLRSPRNRPAPCIMSSSGPSTKPPRTLHHEHQLPLRSPRNRPAPCIMSMSCPCALHETASHPAS